MINLSEETYLLIPSGGNSRPNSIEVRRTLRFPAEARRHTGRGAVSPGVRPALPEGHEQVDNGADARLC